MITLAADDLYTVGCGSIGERHGMGDYMFNLRRSAFALSMICATALSSGCAEFTHLTRYNSSYIGKQHLTLIDAKQRAITTMEKVDRYGQPTGGISTCAEPSPDALSAIAASQNVGLTRDDIEANMAMTLAESASSIGLRTQSIQLMRDAMYRLCESAQSGFIDPMSYQTLMRRYQNSMVAVLAIEQLTGATKPAPVVLTGAIETPVELIAKYTEQTELYRAKVKGADTALGEVTIKKGTEEAIYKAALEKALKDAGKDPAKDKFEDLPQPAQTTLTPQKQKLAAAEADVEAKKASRDAQKAVFESYDAARKKLIDTPASVRSTASLSASSGGIDPATAAAVSLSVKEIVFKTLEQSQDAELCAVFFAGLATDTVMATYWDGDSWEPTPLLTFCKSVPAFQMSNAPDTTPKGAPASASQQAPPPPPPSASQQAPPPPPVSQQATPRPR